MAKSFSCPWRKLFLAGSLTVSIVGSVAAGPTILVSSSDTLRAALASATGGETLLLAPGQYGRINLWVGQMPSLGQFTDYVKITSQDESHPAVFERIEVAQARYLNFDHLSIQSALDPGEADYTRIFTIVSSTHVRITHCLLAGTDDGNPMNDGIGLGVSDSWDILVENTVFRDWNRGGVFGNIDGLTVRGNTAFHLRSDGFDFAEDRNVLIENNTMHSFNPAEEDHPDFIQFWTNGSSIPSENVVIRGNFLSEREGSGSQGIFIRDEFKLTYRNFTIENNLVNNAIHGITVPKTGHNMVIRNNTVITTPGFNSAIALASSEIGQPDGSGNRVENNVATLFDIADGVVNLNNLTLQIWSRTGENFVDDFFLNARHVRSITDLFPLPGSAVFFGSGLGAEARLNDFPRPAAYIQKTTFPGTRDSLKVELAAVPYPGGPVPSGTFQWTFGDGTTGTGESVTHTYTAGGEYDITLSWDGGIVHSQAWVNDPVLIHMDLDGSLGNRGDVRATIKTSQPPSYGPGASGGQAVHFISGQPRIDISSVSDQLSGIKQLIVSFDLRSEGPPTGRPLFMLGTYGFAVSPDGFYFFLVTTDTAKWVNAPAPQIGDGNWHRLAAVYDSAPGALTLLMDGEIVATDAGFSGQVNTAVNRDLTLGTDGFGANFSGWLDNLQISQSTMTLAPPFATPPDEPPPPTETTQPHPPRAFPVPWDPEQHPGGMTLSGFDPESSIFLYSATGKKVRSFIAEADGTYLWDGRDNDHQVVPSGIYLISGVSQGVRRTLKVAVKH